MNQLLVAMFVFALPLSSMAAATQACDKGTVKDNGITGGIQGSTANFIRSDLVVKCSANVNLGFQQSAVGIGVGSNSIKGKKSFNGSSFGGAVAAQADCPSTGCTSKESDAALAAIPNIGSL